MGPSEKQKTIGCPSSFPWGNFAEREKKAILREM